MLRAVKVKVRPEVGELTDGRARFAGREGTIERAPLGRLAAVTGTALPGEHFEHAYEVRFDDGDEAIFTAQELEGEGLVAFRPLEGTLFGAKDAGSISESAIVDRMIGEQP